MNSRRLYTADVMRTLTGMIYNAERFSDDMIVDLLDDSLPGRERETADDDIKRLKEALRLLMLARDHVENAGIIRLAREGYHREHVEGQ